MKPTLSEWRGVGGVLLYKKNPWTVKKFIAQSKDTKPVIQNNIITESESSRPLLRKQYFTRVFPFISGGNGELC